MKIAFILLVPFLMLSACHSKFGKVLKSTDYTYKLKMADEYFANAKYQKAQELYSELFPVLKGSDKFEELYYKYAFCSYYQKDYTSAESMFSGFLGIFPNSPKAEEIAYMQALSYYKQSPQPGLDQVNTQKAIGMMQGYITKYPNSPRIPDAIEIIAKSRSKLETKDYKNAQLYYDLRQYKAAGISFNDLMNKYPESKEGEQYMLMAIKSYYQYAKLSVPSKQVERYEKVNTEFLNFQDKFPESALMKEAQSFNNLSQINIKKLQDEQIKASANR
ncbi:MAG: outer membrane protein assembly factor BamD [Ginsengibacter sp.]